MAENNRPSQSAVPAASAAAGGVQAGMTPGNPLNERTYQEVEYLKKNLGPILVAALAEICIRRPADPIEYLGHWLLRWRYNEELKRRDVQNALEVVRRKTWNDGKEQEAIPNLNAPSAPPAPETFTEGFVPSHAYGPPGFGGPLSGEQIKAATTAPDGVAVAPSADQVAAAPEVAAEPAELAPDAEALVPSGSGLEQPKRASLVPTSSGGAQEKRASIGAVGSDPQSKLKVEGSGAVAAPPAE